jgi:hypothetical protein
VVAQRLPCDFSLQKLLQLRKATYGRDISFMLRLAFTNL